MLHPTARRSASVRGRPSRLARVAGGLCCALLLLGGRGMPAGAQEPAARLEQYLRSIGVGASELATATGGVAVARQLRTSHARDVAVFGMVGVRASRDSIVARLRTPATLLAAPGRRFRVLSDPPSAADVRDVGFDRSELGDLRKCRPGDCDFKLPASAIREFTQGIDWSARDAGARADERLRTGLLQLALDYERRGDAAMLTYDDTRGTRASDVFAELLAQTPDLYEYAPALQRHLQTYPADRTPAMHDVLYWSEDRLPQLRPTLTLNHVVVHAPPGRTALAARKQLYASHYFEGGFELLAVVEAPDAAGAPRTYLLTVRRYRFDNLPGGLLNLRGRVRERLVESTRADLERVRAALESTGRP